MGKYTPYLIGIFLIMFHVISDPAFCAEQDQTFLLNESRIFGSVPRSGAVPWNNEVRYVEFPALSTSLPWEGGEEEELNIPKEILDHLSESTPSDEGNQDLKLGQAEDDLRLD